MIIEKFSPEEIKLVQEEISNKKDRGFFRNLSIAYRYETSDWKFREFVEIKDDVLLQKLHNDPVVAVIGGYAFFPQCLEFSSPKIKRLDSTRGEVAIITEADMKIVIKPLQAYGEDEIASIASESGIGPRQFKSIDNYLTEEFVKGSELLVYYGHVDSSMHDLGFGLGKVLKVLNDNKILYNDSLEYLKGNLGSHLRFDGQEVKLLDYGVSIKLDRDPLIIEEKEFFKFIGKQLFNSNNELGCKKFILRKIKGIREELAAKDYDKILSKNNELIEHTMNALSKMYGNGAKKILEDGFNEAYKA